MAVEVFHVHHAHAPRKIRGRLTDVGSALFVFLVQFVDVIDENRHLHARLPLATFTQKNRHFVPADAAECRRFPPVPGFSKSEDIDVVVQTGGEVLDVENFGVRVE